MESISFVDYRTTITALTCENRTIPSDSVGQYVEISIQNRIDSSQ